MHFPAAFCWLGLLSSEYCDQTFEPSVNLTGAQESPFAAVLKNTKTCKKPSFAFLDQPICSVQLDELSREVPVAAEWNSNDKAEVLRPTITKPAAPRPAHAPYIAPKSSREPPPTTTSADVMTMTPSARMPISSAAIVGQKWTRAKPTSVLSYATRPYSGRVTIAPVSAETTNVAPMYTTGLYLDSSKELHHKKSNLTIVYVTVRTIRGRDDGHLVTTPTKMSLGPTFSRDAMLRKPVVTAKSEGQPLKRAARPGAIPRVQPLATASPKLYPVVMPITK